MYSNQLTIRFVFAFTLFILVTTNLPGQNTGQDKENTTSVLLPVGGITASTSKALVGINYSIGTPWIFNSVNPDPSKPLPAVQKWLFQFSASGANSDGSAALFSKGYFVPESKATTIAGRKFYAGGFVETYNSQFKDISNNYHKTEKNKQLNQRDIRNLISKLEKKSSNKGLIDSLKLLNGKDNDDSVLINKFKARGVNTTSSNDTKKLTGVILDKYKKRIDENNILDSTNSELRKSNENLFHKIKSTQYLSIIYWGAQRYGRTFYLFDSTKSSFSERYAEQNFSGYSAFMGYNGFKEINEKKTFIIIGVRVGRDITDNYNRLSKFEVESTDTYSSGNRSDEIKDKRIVAQDINSYHAFDQTSVTADLVFLFKCDTAYIGICPYYRGAFIDQKFKNKYGMKDSWSWGISANFFSHSGAFAGGIYAELPMPPGTTDNRSWHQRMTVGITTTFNFKKFNFIDLFGN